MWQSSILSLNHSSPPAAANVHALAELMERGANIINWSIRLGIRSHMTGMGLVQRLFRARGTEPLAQRVNCALHGDRGGAC